MFVHRVMTTFDMPIIGLGKGVAPYSIEIEWPFYQGVLPQALDPSLPCVPQFLLHAFRLRKAWGFGMRHC